MGCNAKKTTNNVLNFKPNLKLCQTCNMVVIFPLHRIQLCCEAGVFNFSSGPLDNKPTCLWAARIFYCWIWCCVACLLFRKGYFISHTKVASRPLGPTVPLVHVCQQFNAKSHRCAAFGQRTTCWMPPHWRFVKVLSLLFVCKCYVGHCPSCDVHGNCSVNT